MEMANASLRSLPDAENSSFLAENSRSSSGHEFVDKIFEFQPKLSSRSAIKLMVEKEVCDITPPLCDVINNKIINKSVSEINVVHLRRSMWLFGTDLVLM